MAKVDPESAVLIVGEQSDHRPVKSLIAHAGQCQQQLAGKVLAVILRVSHSDAS
jgi:hypothetical protein